MNYILATLAIAALAIVLATVIKKRSGSLWKDSMGDTSRISYKTGTIATSSAFLLLVLLLTLIGLHRTETGIRKQSAETMREVLRSTHEAIKHIWLEDLFHDAQFMASDPIVVDNIKALLEEERDQAILAEHPAQRDLRDYFQNRLTMYDALGMFVIAPDCVNLGSMRNSNLGVENLIAQHYPERLTDVFRGKQAFIPPIPSDVPLPNRNGQLVENAPTMFILTPVKDEQDKVIAALSVRLDPQDNFSKIAQTGQIGSSGESYLFDSEGRMITESRFYDQLEELDLFTEGSDSYILHYLTDPGVNLVAGEKPAFPDQRPLTLMARQAIAGKSGSSEKSYRDYRGVPVLGSWLWDDDIGIGFASEIDEQEALGTYREMRTIVIGLLAGTILIGATFYYLMNRFRSQALQAVAESESYLSAVLENAIDSIVTINEQGIIKTFNQAAEKLFGYKASEVIGENVRILMPEPHHSSHNQYLENYISSGQEEAIGMGLEVEARRKDGSLLPARLGISDTTIGEKRVFTAILHDLTEQKNAEAALRKSEQSLAEAQRIARLGNWELEFSNREMHWSDQQFRLWGLNPKQDTGSYSNFLNAIHPDDRDGLEKTINIAINNNSIFETECALDAFDGEERIVYIEGRSYSDMTGQPVRMMGISIDITERRLAEKEQAMIEAQLRQAQKLESVGQLTAGIAHEINTPVQYVHDNVRFTSDEFEHLKSLLSMYETLSQSIEFQGENLARFEEIERLKEESDLSYVIDEIPTALEQSLQGLGRITKLVQALKEFSHPGQTEKSLTNINDALENTILVARCEWKYLAEMVTDFDLDIPPVPCLPAEINQVFLNLIVNAAHAIGDTQADDSDGKGVITISTRQADSSVVIRIRDTGTGIPENIRNRIFDPFFTTKKVGKGTGQGLAISYSVIVDKHGGDISFTSEPGEGTEFIIRLPIKQNQTATSA